MFTIQHLIEIIPGEVDNDVELRVTWYRVTENHEGRRSRVDAEEEEGRLSADGTCRVDVDDRYGGSINDGRKIHGDRLTNGRSAVCRWKTIDGRSIGEEATWVAVQRSIRLR